MFFAWGVACVATASCVACDDEDCRSELSVVVHEASDLPLRPGRWTFTVVLDDDDPISETCDVAVGAVIATCDGDIDLSSGPALPGEPLRSFELHFAAEQVSTVPAATIDIHIERADTTIHDEQHTPIYDGPNAGQCEEGCKSATVDIAVDE